jgi:hypothetical protein
MTNKLYLVETVSMFRLRYVVEAKNEEDALDAVEINANGENFIEFSQKHLDEVVACSRKISKEEYLEIYNKDNTHAYDLSDKQKFKSINKIDYTIT